MALSSSEDIVCVIGLSKCFISRVQNACVKCAVQALPNWQWKESILLEMSGSGAWNFHNSFLACSVFLILMKRAIDVDRSTFPYNSV